MDLRKRIAKEIKRGSKSFPLIAEQFGVSRNSVIRIAGKIKRGESLEPRKAPKRATKLQKEHNDWLVEQLRDDPYQSTYTLAASYCRAFPTNKVHRSTILRALKQQKLSYKKNTILTRA